VPEIVKKQIRDENEEGSASNGATRELGPADMLPEWNQSDSFKLFADFRFRDENDLMFLGEQTIRDHRISDLQANGPNRYPQLHESERHSFLNTTAGTL